MAIRKNTVYKHTAINVLIVMLIIALYLATAAPISQPIMGKAYSGPIYRGSANGKVSLQCAVSWNASSLETILDELKDENVQITFLVSGEWAKNNPDMLKRIVADGHEIGTLGMSPSSDGNLSWVEEDISESMKVISDICGITPALYYSGDRNIAISSKAAKRCEITQVMCTVDLLCARGQAEDIVTRALEKQLDGSIMLLQPTAAAAQALPKLLDAFDKTGLAVVSTGKVIEAGQG